MLAATLCCEECGWQTVCGQRELEQRLRKLGLLRRASHPPEEMVSELLTMHLCRLACDSCQAVGLLIVPDEGTGRDDDWQQAVVCEVCHEPIDPERLEIFPSATHCVGCQTAEDKGEQKEEFDFCSKCGALLELRVSRAGGITRYKQFCTGNPPCRL